MIEGITILTNNLGISVDVGIWALLFLAAFLGFAYNYQLGLITDFVVNAGVFMWFYNWNEVNSNINWWMPLTTLLIIFVMLCFSLYNVNRTSTLS